MYKLWPYKKFDITKLIIFDFPCMLCSQSPISLSFRFFKWFPLNTSRLSLLPGNSFLQNWSEPKRDKQRYCHSVWGCRQTYKHLQNSGHLHAHSPRVDIDTFTWDQRSTGQEMRKTTLFILSWPRHSHEQPPHIKAEYTFFFQLSWRAGLSPLCDSPFFVFL